MTREDRASPGHVALHVPEDPHRQSRRDRASHPAGLPRARHPAPSRCTPPRMPRRCMCAWPTRASASARRRRSDSYLNIPAILSAAAITGAEAIHPGYGFLVRERRLRRDGGGAWARPSSAPRPTHIRMMGDKIAAKARDGDGSACRWCPAPTARCRISRRRATSPADIGYPVLIKAAAGGGGRGMKVARRRRIARGGVPRRPHRGARRVRQRRGLYREISRPARAISNCRCWPTRTATSCISASATAACSGGTRSCWRKPARRR